MKKRLIQIILLLCIVFLLASCREENHAERVPSEIVDVGHLSGTLNILAPRPPIDYGLGNQNGFIHFYVDLFTNLHPDVEIIFEYYAKDWTFDNMGDYRPTMPQLTALTTRLLADPPDLFLFDPSNFVIEKTNVDALFVDLYNFMYGPRGLDFADYFDNIFTAMELRGSLYCISPYVSFDMILLNRRLFHIIGVDADAFSAISMGELLDYYQRIAEVYDGSPMPLSFNRAYSFPDVLLHEALYDIEAKTVNVNTPLMKERMEIAMNIHEGDRPDFTPEAWMPGVWGISPGGSDAVFNPVGNLVIPRINDTSDVRITYLQNHPDMQFTNPVHLLNDNGDISFSAFSESFSIMRQSKNQELAWEFIRFVMEFEDSMQWLLPNSKSTYSGYTGHGFFPVNRAKFENRMSEVADEYFGITEHFDQISRFIDDFDARKAEQVPAAVDYYREAMGMLNHQNKRNWAVIQSLIYPDIWLLHSGQQDIERALSNIQSRLELYINE